MNLVSIKIENLKCQGCASTIKKGLLKIEEVKEVKIDVEQSQVEVSYEGDETIVEKCKAKLKGLGYPEVGENTGFSVAKSYVSCAIGKINQ